MRSRRCWLALALTVGLLAAQPAFADVGDLDGIIAGLNDTPVYVQNGAATPETFGLLLNQLSQSLAHDDRIVILIFQQTAGDPGEIAMKVDKALGGDRIVGVSVGEATAGYSSVLPFGVASELMKRASTVSTSTPEAMGTFIQNVRDWQKAHPKAVAAKPTKKESGFPFVGIGVFLFCVGMAAIGSIVFFAGRRDEEHVQLKKSPDRVRDQLRKLLAEGQKVEDSDVRLLVTQIANDVEAYFRRTKDADERDRDAFVGHLSSLNSVLEKYIDVQDNPRYFEDPAQLLLSGKKAFEDFSYFVLETVRREGRRSLMDYSVDTDILSAQRYR